jgi:hypothetical protein
MITIRATRRGTPKSRQHNMSEEVVNRDNLLWFLILNRHKVSISERGARAGERSEAEAQGGPSNTEEIDN